MFNVDFTGYEGDIYLTGLMMKKWVISWDMRYLTQLKKEYHIFNRYVFFSDLQNPEKKGDLPSPVFISERRLFLFSIHSDWSKLFVQNKWGWVEICDLFHIFGIVIQKVTSVTFQVREGYFLRFVKNSRVIICGT